MAHRLDRASRECLGPGGGQGTPCRGSGSKRRLRSSVLWTRASSLLSCDGLDGFSQSAEMTYNIMQLQLMLCERGQYLIGHSQGLF